MSEMNIEAVLQLLPHRFPFLLIDRVVSFEENKTLTAIKNVTYNEPFFIGHFPTRPVMPGVLMIEAIAQAAGLLALRSIGVQPGHRELFFFAGIDNARFKRIVEPGDQLEITVEVLRARSELWKVEGKVMVEGQLACSATVMIARGGEDK